MEVKHSKCLGKLCFIYIPFVSILKNRNPYIFLKRRKKGFGVSWLEDV
jgi:hypothetical protein